MSASPSLSPTSPPKPLLRIRPTSSWQAINFREIWAFRDLIGIMAGRDVKLRYRQTALGVIWVIMQPLMGAAIFSFLSGAFARPGAKGLIFPLTFTGMLVWTAFSSTLTKSSSCLIQNTNLVSKIYFPRLVLPLSTVVSSLIDFCVGLAMLVVFLFLYHIAPTPALLLLPVWLFFILMLSLGIGLIAAGLTVQYRDVQFVLPVMVQFMLLASPTWYTISRVPEKYHLLYMAYPLSGLLDACRWSVTPELPVHWGAVVYSMAFAVIAFVAGAYLFRSMERRFADVI
jgi:lipopolysaccharide transport system permease protein